MNILILIWNAVRHMPDTLGKILAGQVAILAKLDQIYRLIVFEPPEGPPVNPISFAVQLNENGPTAKGVTGMQMTADQKVAVSISITNPVTGKPAKVDGVPVWATSDETVITVEPAADGMSATVSGVTAGDARVVVTADADLGAGVSTISGALDFTIEAGALPTITLTAGVPEAQ